MTAKTNKLHEGKALGEWLLDNRMNAPKLAEALEISKQSVYHQLSLEKLSESFLFKMQAKGFDFSPTARNEARIADLGAGVMKVPLVGQYAYAGYLGGFSDSEFMEGLPTIPFHVDREYKGIYMAFEVRGDSMDDGTGRSYFPGDILLCRDVGRHNWSADKLHIDQWDFVIVHKTDGILIKEITAHDKKTGIITLHSYNPHYEDMDVNLKDVQQIFSVIEIKRKRRK